MYYLVLLTTLQVDPLVDHTDPMQLNNYRVKMKKEKSNVKENTVRRSQKHINLSAITWLLFP
jgi:hypothetical protein